MRSIHVIDSHTGGEPTRIVLEGGPDLGPGPLTAQLARFREEYDPFRSAIVNEPRGSDVIVGGLLVPPCDPSCAAGVIFFNNVGYLGMCGHGTIGLVATLAFLGRLQPGRHRIETPVGIVGVALAPDGAVSVQNVPSYRKARGFSVSVEGLGEITGDIAWGGNWFYLVENHGQSLARNNVESLADLCWRIRRAINAAGYPEVDHIELFGPPTQAGAHSRNFVLCPGKAYDRSPCGTGTSAKLACLAADGKLAPGERWVQESILGSTLDAQYEWADPGAGTVCPTITGRAFVTAQSTLLIDPNDPLGWGVS